MSLLNTKDKTSSSALYHQIADHFIGKFDIYPIDEVKVEYDGEVFSIDSGEYDLGAIVKSSILNDMSRCIGKLFTLKANINMGIMMTENMHTLHPINIHTNSGLEILLPNDDSNNIKNFCGVNIKTNTLYITLDKMHISNSDIQAGSIHVVCEDPDVVINNFRGNINAEKIVYSAYSNGWASFIKRIEISILSKPNGSEIKTSDPIKEFGLDAHNIQTYIFVRNGEYFCITKNINKYSHNRWIYKIANEWYLVYSRYNEIIYL